MSRAGMFTINPQEREISVPVSSRSRGPVQNLCSRVPAFLKCQERGSAGTQIQERAPTSAGTFFNFLMTILFKDLGLQDCVPVLVLLKFV